MNYLIFLLFLFKHVNSSEWSYDAQNNWGTICTIGEKQSPINIITKKAVLDKHGMVINGPLRFQNYRKVEMHALNNGHTLRWNVVDKNPPILSGGPLKGKYRLAQFHVHWVSEHALNKVKYPLEIHLVHIKANLTPEAAAKRRDGIAVIGVLAQVIGENYRLADEGLHQLTHVLPQLQAQSNGSTINAGKMNLEQLMSSNPQEYYTYEGSLTTPGCQEVVTWIIMANLITVTDKQYKLMRSADVGADSIFRYLQPSNGRPVFRSVPSCSSLPLPEFQSTATLIGCISANMSKNIKKMICSILKKKGGTISKECENLLKKERRRK